MLSRDTRELARGRWRELLIAAGVPHEYLDRKGHPCPKCGGDDRFSVFRDFSETGAVHCRHCFTAGADGIATIQWLLGLTFVDACNWIHERVGRISRLEAAKGSMTKPTTFATADAATAALDRFMHKRHQAYCVCHWDYHSPDGNRVAVVVRYESDGKKTYRPVSKHDDGWHWGDPPGLWPLYGLAELGSQPGTVFIVEGEKCSDAVKWLGLQPVTSAHGARSAAKTDWSPLAGADRVVILPDNDDAGRRYADDVEAIVSGLGVADVRLLELPGLPPGGDVCDWIATQQRPPDELCLELERLADQTTPIEPDEPERPRTNAEPRRRPKLVRLADVQPEAVDWLWPGRIALGKLTLLTGDPGLGKSFLTIDLAARVTTGRAWPDSPGTLNSIGSVVMLSAEDDLADTIRPRLDAARADCSKVFCLQAVVIKAEDRPEDLERGFSLTTDCEVLEATLRQVADCRLLVVDPITAYLAGVDSHRNAELRAVLQPLSDLAAAWGVAVVAVTHLNKSHGAPVIYRSMGSLAFTAAARAVWAVSKDQDDQRRRLVLPVKNNVAADGTGLAYRIAGEPPRVEWESGTVALTADDALAPPEEREERSERERARDWLKEVLAGGPLGSVDLIADGREHGLSEKTLRRAFRDIGGRPRKAGPNGTWLWSL